MTKERVIIIGAGLTGLTLAYLLKKKGVKAVIIEARERLGGRIHTTSDGEDAPIEMGATWIGKKHTQICQLLEELHIPLFEQRLGRTAIYEPISTSPPQLVQLPPNEDPSYRISGGSSNLIDSLVEHLEDGQLQLNEVVQEVNYGADVVTLKTDKGQYQCVQLVSTLPPNLLVSNIRFQPLLSDEIVSRAKATHTWMGESIKIALRYEKPFWREKGRSGTIFSNVGPIPEMYDHSNFADTRYALKGFFNGAYNSVSKEYRLDLIMKQLKKYFGDEVDKHASYEEMVWSQEPYTFSNYEEPVLPHQNNGHKIYERSHYDNHFFISGSETSSKFPGYMEGAVHSAYSVFQKLPLRP